MTITIQPTAPTAPAATNIASLDERRLAGIGAIVFASLVVITNILQGSMPAMNADSAEVVAYITDHRAQNMFATVGFALGAPFLLMFASAFYGRLKAVGRPEDLVWARFGMIGAASHPADVRRRRRPAPRAAGRHGRAHRLHPS